MKLKTLVAATSLALASVAAQAALLDSLEGAKTWHISGLSAENDLTASGPAGDGAAFGDSKGWETTWAVGSIDQIFKTPITASNTWNAGEGGVFLNYMIYGIADDSATFTGSGFDLFNTGATKDVGADGKIHIDVYKSSTAIDLNNVQTTSRCGYGCFTGLTDAPNSLYLSTVMSAEYFSGDLITSLFQQVSALQLPTTGSGFFFLNVDPTTTATGTAKWDSNSVDNIRTPYLDGFDFGGRFDLITVAEAQANGSLESGANYKSTGFAGYLSDPLTSRALPEPGSLALLGLSLAGLGALRRRKQKD